MPAAAEARPEVPAPPEEEDEPTPAPVHRASMAPVVAVVLADGKVVQLPGPPPKREGGEGLNEELTARDLVSALRAVARGVDASEILGEQPRWEAMFSALLSLLLRRGLIADWEFVEEFRKL
jgi:type IV pilus assembly protein PilB